MPGHTYWRTITANRKSITKASSSLLDFSSIFPTLRETQARYVNPAAQPALAVRPQSPTPWRHRCAPLPLPSTPSVLPRRQQQRRPSPLPSFPAGSALWLLPHSLPHLHPPTPSRWSPALSPRRSSQEPFRGVSYPQDPSCLTFQLTPPCPSPSVSPSTFGGSVAPITIPLHPQDSSKLLSPRPLGAQAAASSPAPAVFLPKTPKPSLFPAPGCPPRRAPGVRSRPGELSFPGGGSPRAARLAGGDAARCRWCSGREQQHSQMRAASLRSAQAPSPRASWNFAPFSSPRGCSPLPTQFPLTRARACESRFRLKRTWRGGRKSWRRSHRARASESGPALPGPE